MTILHGQASLRSGKINTALNIISVLSFMFPWGAEASPVCSLPLCPAWPMVSLCMWGNDLSWKTADCWLCSIALTLEKGCVLVLTCMGWKEDLFCRIMCPVQLVVHIDEGPSGDSSKCVCQLPSTTAPWFLLFLRYPGVTSVSMSVSGEEIFSNGNF